MPKIKEFKLYDGLKVQTSFKGGESEGEKRMDKFCKDTLRVVNFRKPMTNPTSLKPDTTAISAYLKFGSMSIRTFYWKITDIYNSSKASHTTPPESLIG